MYKFIKNRIYDNNWQKNVIKSKINRCIKVMILVILWFILSLSNHSDTQFLVKLRMILIKIILSKYFLEIRKNDLILFWRLFITFESVDIRK